MKSFKSYISEEVLPTANVENGNFDIENEAVRSQVNGTLAAVTAQPAVTPYVLLRKVSKALSYFHIILPKRTFLEGNKGVEVYEVMQFGDRMGMTDAGEFVKEVPEKYYLFFQYGIAHPFNVTYTKPNIDGMYRGMAKIVDKAELDRLLSAAESMMAESCDDKATMSQRKAGREEIQTNGNHGTPSTDKAMDTSEKKSAKVDKVWPAVVKEEEQIDEASYDKLDKYVRSAHVSGTGAAARGEIAMHRGQKTRLHRANKTGEKREQGINLALDKMAGRALVPAKRKEKMEEEYEKVEAGVKKRPGETHTLHRRNPGHKTEYHTITTERDGRKSVKTGSPKYIKKHWDKLEEVSKGAAIRAYGASQDPDDEDHYKTGERLKGHIVRKFGKKAGEHAERHAYAAHFGRSPTMMKADDKLPKKAPSSSMRTTSKGTFNKQDTKSLGGIIKRRLGSHTTPKHLPEEYGVFRKGGSIGEKPSNEPHKTFDSAEEAKAHAKGMNKQLSPGEKKYYRIKYHVKPIKEEQIDELHGKGSLEKIRSHHQGEANKLSQGGRKQEKRMGALGRLHRDSEDREDAIKHHMGKAKKARGLMSKLAMREDTLEEKHLTPSETRKKEEIVMSMKKGLPGFKERYGKRAKEVMYATATKRAKEQVEEGMTPIKKSYAMRKMKKKVSTQVKQGLGVGKEKTSTVLVTNKGDPKAAGGGGVHRIPRDKYDPTKHNLASE